MLKAGYKQTLHLTRFTDNGAYLMDEALNEVLLPNRYVTKKMAIGSSVEVFIYHDSEDRIVATTDWPIIMCDEIDALEVVDISSFGAFLDWGLPKDLFLPKSNFSEHLVKGDIVVVGIYTDGVTGRVVATTKLNMFVSNDNILVKEGDNVRVVVAQRNELGFRVVINDKNWGVMYDNQIFQKVEIGDSFWCWVTKITPDNRIDVSLQKPGFDGVVECADIILKKLSENGGTLPVHDKSSPEEIYSTFQLSKKLFKRSVGHLMKEGRIEQRDGSLTLLNKKIDQESSL